ncbi:alpha/beta hydrolase [Pseudofulvimonas gallinarii]|jgi:predicted alpha/beta hydrolase|nr:alpha/beta hydrolase [Pseudofulvimonas gallinarii]
MDPMIESRTFSLCADDGHELAATHYPARVPVQGAVVIASAMGVSQGYYRPFSEWLAGQGWHVLTFDYRGIGRSRRGPLRRLEADVLTWARRDCAAAVDAAAALAPGKPLTWIGHSLGGQLFAMVPNRDRVDRVLTVATGSGYWRENAPALKRVVWWLWYVVVPVVLPLAGYFPGRRLRKIGDLPRGVMAQWRRWCLHPDYAVGIEGDWLREAYASVGQPMTILSFCDDEYMSERNTVSLHAFYANAAKTWRRVDPAGSGLRRIGHFGFFRSEPGGAVWEKLVLPALDG